MSRSSMIRENLSISAIAAVLSLVPESALLGQLVWNEQTERVLPPREFQAWDGFVHAADSPP